MPVIIEPWNPWPLAIPLLLLLVAVVLSVLGTRRRSKPMREGGYALFLVSALAFVAMTWSLSGMHDANARTAAFEGIGLEDAVFSGDTSIAEDGDLPPFAFTAVRDGERVSGVLVHVDGDRWIVKVDGG